MKIMDWILIGVFCQILILCYYVWQLHKRVDWLENKRLQDKMAIADVIDDLKNDNDLFEE